MGKARGTRGYSSYRGRGRGVKVALTVLLALLLLAACAFLFAQRYIVYEEDGSFRFVLPWPQQEQQEQQEQPSGGEDTQPDGDAGDVEVVVQEPEVRETHGVELSLSALTGDWTASLPEGTNAVAVRLKESSGRLLYDSKLQAAIDCGAVAGGSVARSAIEELTGSDYYSIARISTLHDSIFAFEHMTDAAVCQLTGYVWYDTYSTHWLAPEKELARQYISDIAVECADMGFDELLLDDFHYPRDGRMSRIKTDERTMSKQEALSLLADDIRAALKAAGYEGKLSVSVDADIVLAGSEERTGIVMSTLSEKFDRVYVSVKEGDLETVKAALDAENAVFVAIVSEKIEGGNYLLEK